MFGHQFGVLTRGDIIHPHLILIYFDSGLNLVMSIKSL